VNYTVNEEVSIVHPSASLSATTVPRYSLYSYLSTPLRCLQLDQREVQQKEQNSVWVLVKVCVPLRDAKQRYSFQPPETSGPDDMADIVYGSLEEVEFCQLERQTGLLEEGKNFVHVMKVGLSRRGENDDIV
jgi:hypothetical protein